MSLNCIPHPIPAAYGVLTAFFIGLMLTACGGGGGGASATIGSFTKFSAMTVNTPVRMQGASQEATQTSTAGGTIMSVGTVSTFGPTATADIKIGSNGYPNSIAFTSANGTAVSMSTAAGDTLGYLIVDPRVGAAISSNNDKLMLYATSTGFGWDYQTFGVWATGIATTSTSGTAGSFSLGALTAGANIPTTGTATYNGASGGFYVDPSGNAYFTVANVTAGTDFGARTITFNTTGTTQSQTLLTGSFSANSALDLSGTLSYAAATNRFTGVVASVGGGVSNSSMTGTATGYFYGPAAEEIGGGFAVKGTGTANYFGGFGGKK